MIFILFTILFLLALKQIIEVKSNINFKIFEALKIKKIYTRYKLCFKKNQILEIYKKNSNYISFFWKKKE